MVSLLTLLPILTSLFAVLPSVTATPQFDAEVDIPVHNLTERTFGVWWNWNNKGWSSHKCANVQGNWKGYQFNFGCLCEADVDDFCQNNNINTYVKSLLNYYIDIYGQTNSYPKNSQPTCNGGNYNCGSLPMKSDGTCGTTTCDPRQCSTNGGCCPRGQTYQNGQCCGRVGCSRNGQTCTPVYSCPSGSQQSNGVCCPNGQTGYESKYCCPAGQTGQNGQCVCPAGTTKNGDKCDSVCKTNEKWCYTKCCPSGSSEDKSSGKCVCDDPQKKLVTSNGVSSCVNKCDDGWSFCNSVCCPAGATEDGWTGKCKCTSNQQQLSADGKSCVNKCSNGQSFSVNKCCPAGSSQPNSYSDCKCNDSNQELKTVNGVQQCVNKCKNGHNWCKTKCCPSYLNEDGNGNCVCSDDAYSDNGWACVKKCKDSEKYNYSTKKCESICDSSAGYYYQTGWKNNGMCCKKGQTACNTVCCPPGKEEIDHTGVCCNKGASVVNGKCVEPTGKVSTPKRRALAGRFDLDGQIIVEPSAREYGIEANKEGKLCPGSLAACPIPGRESEYECLETKSDLQSCGGCMALGHGTDCTQIPGARWMGCNSGKCEVYSCIKGWKRGADGASCVRI